MRIPSAKKYFAILALLLCQLTIFAHIAQHAVLETDTVCQICVHAPGLNAGFSASTLPTVTPAVSHETPFIAAEVPTASIVPRYTPIRGPPAFLA